MNQQQPEAPPTEVVYGIAKKMTLELEKLPLHTHATIVNMLRMTVEHRKVELDNQVQAEQIKAQEVAMADARKAHAQKQVQYESQLAEQIRKTASQQEEKAPRLSIVLDGGNAEKESQLEAVAV